MKKITRTITVLDIKATYVCKGIKEFREFSFQYADFSISEDDMIKLEDEARAMIADSLHTSEKNVVIIEIATGTPATYTVTQTINQFIAYGEMTPVK